MSAPESTMRECKPNHLRNIEPTETSEANIELSIRERPAVGSEPIPPAGNTTEPASSTPHLKLLSASLSFFVAGANDGSFGSLLPSILNAYSIHSSSIALLYLCTFLGWFLCALTSSHAAKFLNLGSLLTIGAVSQLLSQALRAWQPPFALFCVTFFLTGLGQAYQDAFSNTFVSTVGERAHRWLGIIHAMYGFGCLGSPFVAAAIAGNRENEWALFYLFPLGLSIVNLCLVLVAFWDSVGLVRAGGGERERGRSTAAWLEIREMLKMRDLWVLSLFLFFHMGAGTTSGGWVVEYLVRVRHGDVKEIGYVPAGFYGGICLGRLILVEPTHRYGERLMLLLYSIIATGMQLILWLVPHIVSTIAMFTMIGFLMGPFFAAGISVASKVFPKKIQPTALGFIFVVAQAGAAIFPSLIGVITSHVGVQVLPPIVAGLLAAMGITWSFAPKVPNERRD